MITLSIDNAGLTRMERALAFLARRQIPYAASRALNDVARKARDSINARMGETFDRPTPFTTRAVVAPRELAADSHHLQATVTVRPVQAKYLLHEEIGGTRSPSENTRKAASAIVLPGRGLLLDAFGNIPSGKLRQLRADARPAGSRRARKGQGPRDRSVVFLPAQARGNRAGIGGYFQRLAGHRLTRLTGFEGETHYQPRFHYRDRVADVAAANWPEAFRRRLIEAVQTAR